MQNCINRNRKSIRLKEYDYSQNGAYFVTICAQDKKCLFGNIVNTTMNVSNLGQVVQTVWKGLPKHYHHVKLDIFAIMPNHIHGIIWLTEVGAGFKPAPIIADFKPVGAGLKPAPTNRH